MLMLTIIHEIQQITHQVFQGHSNIRQLVLSRSSGGVGYMGLGVIGRLAPEPGVLGPAKRGRLIPSLRCCLVGGGPYRPAMVGGEGLRWGGCVCVLGCGRP